MFAYRKYQAARYHLENVRGYLASESMSARRRHQDIPGAGGLKITEMRTGTRASADHYVYELSAFLEALKSSVDFLAHACCKVLKGTNTDSISTLVKGAKKGLGGPIHDAVRQNGEWIHRMSEYRHHLVHRLLLRLDSGSETRVVGGQARTAMYPVAVPRNTPKYTPDTRQSRMMDQRSLDERSSCTYEVGEGGVRKVVSHDFSFAPPAGYVSIDEFMTGHLRSFETCFVALIRAIESVGFRPRA
jgi:hypothetical protein